MRVSVFNAYLPMLFLNYSLNNFFYTEGCPGGILNSAVPTLYGSIMSEANLPISNERIKVQL